MKVGEKKGEMEGEVELEKSTKTQTEEDLHLTVKGEGFYTCIWIYTNNKQSLYITNNGSVVRASEKAQHNQCSSKQTVTSVSNVREEPATGELCLPIWKL